jgi:hypothetical protein
LLWCCTQVHFFMYPSYILHSVNSTRFRTILVLGFAVGTKSLFIYFHGILQTQLADTTKPLSVILINRSIKRKVWHSTVLLIVWQTQLILMDNISPDNSTHIKQRLVLQQKISPKHNYKSLGTLVTYLCKNFPVTTECTITCLCVWYYLN